jgi:parvulin-like peptidyl-prolyl isomerase
MRAPSNALPAGLALVLGVCLPGCERASVAPAPPVLLSLGDQQVPVAEFEAYVAALESSDGPMGDDVREKLLESFLEERVLVLEARERGLLAAGASPEAEQAAVQELLAATVLPGIQVTDAEIAAYYEENAEALGSPETVTLRQILVPTLNEARDVYRRLRKDRRSFGLLARTRSRSPEAEAGGRMGTFERGQLPPELERVAFGLTPGQVGPIVESPLGFHVLLVAERKEAHPRTLDECREQIQGLLMRQAYDAAVRRYIAGLLARAEVNHEAVQSNPAAADS